MPRCSLFAAFVAMAAAVNCTRADTATSAATETLSPINSHSPCWPDTHSAAGSLGTMAPFGSLDAGNLFNGHVVRRLPDSSINTLECVPLGDDIVPVPEPDEGILYTPPGGDPELLTFQYSGICCVSDGGTFWTYNGSQSMQIAEPLTNALPPFGAAFANAGEFAYALTHMRISTPPTEMAHVLLQYDGTSMSEVARLRSRGDPLSHMIGFDGAVYFTAEPFGNPAQQFSVFRYGSDSGLQVVNTNQQVHSAREYFELDDALYFFASEIPGFQTGAVDYLWRVTDNGIERVDQVRPFGYDGSPGEEAYEPTLFQGAIYFAAGLDRYSPTIWRFDGESVIRVTDMSFHNRLERFEFTVDGDRLLFYGFDTAGQRSVYELTAVPEPTGFAMLCGALGLLLVALKRAGATATE